MPEKKSLEFYPGLEGLRALAIGLVILFHWMPNSQSTSVPQLPLGPMGVTIFFVLSGFLISGILIKSSKDTTHGFGFKYYVFFMRRALRIFPIYYGMLFVLYILKTIHIQIETDLFLHPLYFFTFTYNFLLENTNNWSDFLSPFWSVSVEEQFYIIWAPLVLLVRNKATLKMFFIATIFLGILVRCYYLADAANAGVLASTCIDCFAWGGLYALIKPEGNQKNFGRLVRLLSLVSLALFLFLFYFGYKDSVVFKLFFRSFISIIALQLIISCTSVSNSSIKRFFEIAGIRFIGKISYSLYLFHMVVPIVIFKLLDHKGYKIGITSHNKWMYSLVFLFLSSVGSWYVLEKPILRLKKYFKY
jgi:peptidoglycan/LPS O-acetylase OafA/YrhL